MLAPTFALFAGRGRGRPAAKLLRLRQICPPGDQAGRAEVPSGECRRPTFP
jgi:hypothetical protein